MKFPSLLFAGALLTGCILSPVFAQTDVEAKPEHERFGEEKTIRRLGHIQIENRQGVHLGRIKDLGLDLPNGRIVEVFVVSGEFLGLGGKVVAVPPSALTANARGDTYRLDVSRETFDAAPGVKLGRWVEAGRVDRVAAAYHFFGRAPYFLEPGESADASAARPKVALGYVQRSSKVLGLSVENLRHESIGKITAISLDVPAGTIREVTVLAPGNFQTRSVIPARSLRFDEGRDHLLFDDSKMPFADQPRIVVTESAYGKPAHSKEESYRGPRTNVALEQGKGPRDRDRTALITKNILAEKIAGLNIQVGTLNGRVTLRGWAYTEEEKDRVGAIAIAASRLELVDNQMTFGAAASDLYLVRAKGDSVVTPAK